MPSANSAVLVQIPLVFQAQHFPAPRRIAGSVGFGHADHVQYVKLDLVPFYRLGVTALGSVGIEVDRLNQKLRTIPLDLPRWGRWERERKWVSSQVLELRHPTKRS